jgi:DNA repair protein RecN (Recombination protein N)
LSSARRTAADEFSRRLERALADLAMARTRCDVRLTDPADESRWSERGLEDGEFFISPNPGEDLKPLAKIASGGELSRIMLALKTIASTDAPGKTLIFDEVDSGIGGAVADVVGRRLQALGERFQVLCITHLPQIAAYGGAHMRIAKSVRRARTWTEVAKLVGPEREEEMARMIGGTDISVAVMASAREMLETRLPRRGAISEGARAKPGEVGPAPTKRDNRSQAREVGRKRI